MRSRVGLGMVIVLAMAQLGPAAGRSQDATAVATERLAIVNPVRVGSMPVISTKELASSRSYRFEIWWGGLDPDSTYTVNLSITGPGGTDGIENWGPTSEDGEGSALWQIPDGWPTGIYRLEATLQRFGDARWDEIARDSFDVHLDSSANRTRATTVPQGTAFYKHKGQRPRARVGSFATATTTSVRFLYTTTDRGRVPRWKPCAVGRVPAGDDSARGLCILEDGDSPRAVELLAAIANDSPSELEVDPSLDAASSVIKARAHKARPRVFLRPNSSIGPSLQEGCTWIFVNLVSHKGVSLWRGNLDLHAKRSTFATVESPSGFSAPDDGAHGDAVAKTCRASGSDGSQGTHPGGPNHVETTAPVADAADVGARMTDKSIIKVWFDFDRDDMRDPGEPRDKLFLGQDLRPSLKTEKPRVKRWKKAKIYGSFDGTLCSDRRPVKLKRKFATTSWKTIAEATASPYLNYDFEIRMKRVSFFKVVAPGGETCKKARSNVLRVRVR